MRKRLKKKKELNFPSKFEYNELTDILIYERDLDKKEIVKYVTKQVPTKNIDIQTSYKEEYKFIGWHTSSDGKYAIFRKKNK